MAAPALPTPEYSTDTSLGSAPPSSSVHGWVGQQAVDDVSFMDISQNTDLDFQLIWPDSEDLFQTLMSADPTAHTPLGTLPLPSDFCPSFTANPFNKEQRPSGETIPFGGGHMAVHGVSKMISNLVRSANHASTITFS